MTLIYLGCAWIAGIYLGSLLRLPIPFLLLLAPLPMAGIVLWWRDQQIRLISTCLLVLLFGTLRYRSTIPRFDERSLAYYNDRGQVTIQGVVADEPDVRDRWINLRVKVSHLEDEEGEHEAAGVALVRAPRYPEYNYGDELEIRGKVETPPQFEDFSYRDYLARQGIYSIMRYPRIARLGRGQGNPFLSAIYALKRRAQATIAAILHDPEASLLTGILLGLERGIPADLMESFARTSTTHIIAISGFNISIVAGILSGLANRLVGKRQSLYLVLGGIALYTILVGADAAVVRAAIMGGLCAIAAHYGRLSDALNSLVASAALMTLHKPSILWDLGFQLSFAATIGLVLYTPILQRWFERLLSRISSGEMAKQTVRLLNDALIVTIAAQITTLPIIVYSFGQLSLVTLITNLLILPAQPGVMIWGGVATILGLIYRPLGQIVGWVAWLFLTYTIRLVEFSAKAPYASISVGRFSAGLVWLYYGLLAGGLIVGGQERSRLKALWQRLTGNLPTKAAIAAFALAALLIWIAVFSMPDGKLHVVFFDVGQGDAIFIQTPQGQQILIDGGPSPTTILAALGRGLPFWDRSLDLVILTHPEEDHLTGLIPVLERYKIGQILHSGQPGTTPAYTRWQELIEQKGIEIQPAQAGMQIDLGGGLWLDVLHPGAELMAGTDSDVNNNSVVVRLVMGEASFLFTGDIEEEAEETILASGQALASTVLKVPHHGAGTSSSARFLERVRPQLAVISVGRDNRFGHPSPETLQRLEKRRISILRTDQNGTIEVVTDGKDYWIKAGADNLR